MCVCVRACTYVLACIISVCLDEGDCVWLCVLFGQSERGMRTGRVTMATVPLLGS